MPLARPRALIAALTLAVTSVVIAIVESTLLLTVRNGMQDNADAALRSEAIGLKWAIQVSLVGSMGIMLLVAAGIVLTVLAKPAGRVLLFIATGLSIGWHLTCGGCLFAAPRTSELSDEIMRYYTMWSYDAAILCGFAAGITAAIGLVCLARPSVNHYFRSLRHL